MVNQEQQPPQKKIESQRQPETAVIFGNPFKDSCYLKTARHYLIQVLCSVPEALGKGYIALGKAHTVKN